MQEYLGVTYFVLGAAMGACSLGFVSTVAKQLDASQALRPPTPRYLKRMVLVLPLIVFIPLAASIARSADRMAFGQGFLLAFVGGLICVLSFALLRQRRD